MCNLKITNENNLVLQYLPVRMTVPENSLQSFLTMANPIPLFAPVTCGIEFIFAKPFGDDLLSKLWLKVK